MFPKNIATGEVADLRQDNSQRYQDAQDYPMLAKLPHPVEGSKYTIKYPTPVFGDTSFLLLIRIR